MRRSVVIGILALLLLLAAALLVARHYRAGSLSPTDLAAKSIAPPKDWAHECSRLVRAVRAAQKQPRHDAGSLNADEVAIYRTLLEHRDSDLPPREVLYVSDRTFPLDVTSSPGVDAACECLDGMEVQPLVDASYSFHRLTKAILPSPSVRLVDEDHQLAVVRQNDPHNWIGRGKSVEQAVDDAFAIGLFSISEIVFDVAHRKALVTTSFVCGGLCGSGRTRLFEKVDGVWKEMDLECGGWVS